MPKCDFNKVALRNERCPINLLYILRTPFPKNTSRGLLLRIVFLILSKSNILREISR